MRRFPSSWLPLALLFFLSLVADGRALTSAGSLRVTVTDAQQHPLPGAECVLLDAADETAMKTHALATAITDAQGVATFNSIAPGSYTLRVESKGFEVLTRAGVVVAADRTNDITLTLAVAAVNESVTVEAPDNLATNVEAGASTPAGNLERRAVQRLPLATARIDEALPLIPGVVRSSTGEISIKGATEQQSALRVNGLNAADPASGNFRLNLPVDSVESVQVFLHPYTAEFGQFTGGVTDIATRRGGNELHLEFNDFLPDLRFKGGKIVGIAEDAPHLNFNGPLIKNRLYFSQSLAYTIAKTPVRGLAFPFNETKTESQSYFSQFDLLLGSRHTQTYTFGYFPERDQYVGLDFFRPQPVTPNYKQKDFVFNVRDTYTLGGGLLQSSFSFKRFNANVWGQGANEQTLTPTVEEGNYFATQARRSSRFELLEIYQFASQPFWQGSHEVKLGFDFSAVTNRLNFIARPVNIRRADETLAEHIVFGSAPLIRASNREYTGFVQDRWKVRSNLSIDLGLRYENQRIADEQNFAPRVGFAWSPFKDDDTVIRGGIGFFYDKVPLNIRAFARYPARTVTRYATDGRTIVESRSYNNVLVESRPVPPLDFSRSNRDAGFVPENLTWNVQLDQTVNSMLSLRANFINSRTVNIYIVNPELDYRGQSAIVLRSAGRATYRALELTARFNLPEKNAIYVTYTRSRSRGDLDDFNNYFGDFGVPVIRSNQYSNLPFDVPNRFLTWGTISLPKRISLAPILEVRSGFPYSVRDAEQNFVGVRNSGRTRFPRFAALDTELAKEFQLTKKYAVRLSLRGFNLTDHFNPRDVRANTADPSFGRFLSSYRRYFAGGFDIVF
ncbi:MAG TPA: carboxypeptidase regulatory-like domain-containing protein [Pyrinomonadaceae bacterium]|nr:carboxypeptidase regulatory-like domain-containing protein [Pyrinomonadaceae bacterium]